MKKLKKKFRKIAMPFAMLFASTTGHASCLKLAKVAGMSQNSLEKIVTKLIKIESRTGHYTVVNKQSGAYGRYQIMPMTASFYAKKLHIPLQKWKQPHNQEKIFRAIMTDNINSLKRRGYKISAFSIYATHQQGASGFNAIMKNKSLTKSLEQNLRQNLPKKLSNVRKSRLRLTWINYWKNRLA